MRRLLPLSLILLAATNWLLAVVNPSYAATDSSLLKTQEGATALLRGKYEQAITSFDQALENANLPKSRRASIYSDRAVAKWRLQIFEEALKDLNKSLELSGDKATTYNNRAAVLIDMGKYEDALKDLNKAISLAPGYGAAYNNRGNVHFQLAHYPAALKDYKHAISLMPTNAAPYNGRAKAQSMMGHPYAGLRYISRAIALNGKYTAAYRNRAQLYQHLELSDNALADYDRLIGFAPKDPTLYIGRGNVYLKQGKERSAFRDFSKALKLDPENPAAFIGRGAAQISRQLYDAALQDLNQAITLNPKLAEAYYHRATAYLRLGDKEQAGEDIAKAIQLVPNYAEAFKLRAELAEMSGNVDDAIADFQLALKSDPFIDGVPEALKRLTGKDEPDRASLKPAVKGWEIISPVRGRYVAINARYPKVHVLLEMHGPGEPEIKDWSILADTLRGFGLLRYSAGDLPNQNKTPSSWTATSESEKKDAHTQYEYIAIVDLQKNITLSIEPYITADGATKWNWSKEGVMVTDAEGLTSAHTLRPAPRHVERSREYSWDDEDTWRNGENIWDRRREERRSYRHHRSRNLLDWLFR
jgi:tetratricopeptide (TPR) repeat protein